MPRRRLSFHLRLFRLAPLALGLAMVAPAAQALPPLQTFTAGLPAGAEPGAAASAPDGDVWFVQSTPGLPLGRITADGTIVEQAMPQVTADLTAGLRDLAGGPDGDAWLLTADTVLQVAPDGSVVDDLPLPAGADAQQLAVAADGSLWFTDQAGSGALGHLTPTGQLTEYEAGLTPHGGVYGIAIDPHGNAWFTERGARRIGVITPAGVITEYGPTSGTPRQIVNGPGGDEWFTEISGENAGVDGVGSITPAGLISEYPTGGIPASIAAGPDGQIYFTEPFGVPGVPASGPVIGTIDSAGGLTQDPLEPLEPFGEASDIVAGTNANLWLTFPLPPGAIGELTFPSAVPPVVAPAAAPAAAATTAPSGPSAPPAAAHGGVLSAATTTEPLAVDGGLDHVSLSPLSVNGVVAGRSVAAGPVSGTIYVRRRRSQARFVLRARAVLPVASVVDARDGIVKLTALRRPAAHAAAAASAAAAVPETVALSGGLFSIAQPVGGHGLVVITLLGGRFGGCPAAGRAHIAVSKRAPPPPRVVRQLWSSDNGGDFSTHGRDSVGTVQGTLWLTSDRCDGTLTHVVRGRVLVQALHARRRVLLRAGQSYLAPAAVR